MLRLFGLVIEVLSWIFQVRVVHFQGRLCRIFGKFFLKVDPAGFTLGFQGEIRGGSCQLVSEH